MGRRLYGSCKAINCRHLLCGNALVDLWREKSAQAIITPLNMSNVLTYVGIQILNENLEKSMKKATKIQNQDCLLHNGSGLALSKIAVCPAL